MLSNEIKKELYKQKPIAKVCHIFPEGDKEYRCYLDTDSIRTTIFFRFPFSEISDEFKEFVPSQLLIRWFHRIKA